MCLTNEVKTRQHNARARRYNNLEPFREAVESSESVVIQRMTPDSKKAPMWTPEHRCAGPQAGAIPAI